MERPHEEQISGGRIRRAVDLAGGAAQAQIKMGVGAPITGPDAASASN